MFGSSPAARSPAFQDPKNFSTVAPVGRVRIAFDQSSRTGVRPRLVASGRRAANSRSRVQTPYSRVILSRAARSPLFHDPKRPLTTDMLGGYARAPAVRVPATEPRLAGRCLPLERGPSLERLDHPVPVPPRPAGRRSPHRVLTRTLGAPRPLDHPVACAVAVRRAKIPAYGLGTDPELVRDHPGPDPGRVHPLRRFDALI
jgi:hypothetical protein